MRKEELAALPEGTTLYVVSRKISRSGMRQTFDVFYMNFREPRYGEGSVSPSWIRISGTDGKDFNRLATCHASTSLDEDRLLGGSFYVKGCGFNRPAEVVESLSTWATGKPNYFRCELI